MRLLELKYILVNVKKFLYYDKLKKEIEYIAMFNKQKNKNIATMIFI